MGVAGLIFEPHPPNFENQYNFWKCSNDAKMIFWFLYWFQIFKDEKTSDYLAHPLPSLLRALSKSTYVVFDLYLGTPILR